jgi:hypothetical protein
VTGHRTTIVFDVSGHGFGHLAQVTPIIQELITRIPNTHIVVRSALPSSVIRSFLGGDIETATAPPEITLVMRSPSIANAMATADGYRSLHAKWDEHLDREATRLGALKPRVLIADVPYLSLAAAKRVGIPAVALCSLNWLDIYRAYCGFRPEAPAILQTIRAAYEAADIFLQTQPHMPMSDLPNRRSIGPIGRVGANRREDICKTLDIPHGKRIVLATVGGIPSDKPLFLPRMTNVQWIAPSGTSGIRKDISDIGQLGMNFIDVLASADAVLTKVGYSTFVEAACNGVGLVSAPRPDWPEAAVLLQWARQSANFAMTKTALDDIEGVEKAVSAVLRAPRRLPVAAMGAAEAFEYIVRVAELRKPDDKGGMQCHFGTDC